MGNYSDVISTNMRNFLPSRCYVTITVLQSKCGEQTGLNINLGNITSKLQFFDLTKYLFVIYSIIEDDIRKHKY